MTTTDQGVPPREATKTNPHGEKTPPPGTTFDQALAEFDHGVSIEYVADTLTLQGNTVIVQYRPTIGWEIRWRIAKKNVESTWFWVTGATIAEVVSRLPARISK